MALSPDFSSQKCLNIRRAALLGGFLICATAFGAQRDVLTANYDTFRTNANLQEEVLRVDTVNSIRFGKLFTRSVDGQVFAQPLYAHGITFANQGTHNVLYVATMHNSVYAFDADAPSANTPLWTVNLGPSVRTSGFDRTDITPEIGILGTPVIDLDSGTIYAVNYTLVRNNPAFFLHALDMTTGAEKFNGPARIQASVAGTAPDSIDGQVVLDAGLHMQRPGLLLTQGHIYIGFGSRADVGNYHGWLLSYDAQDVTRQTSVFCTTSEGVGASIWQGGRAPSLDEQGNIYVSTGNGDYDGVNNFGESVLKFDPSGNLSMNNWFTPSDWGELNGEDADLGSSGPVIAPNTGQILSAGKAAVMYLVDQNQMGDADPDHYGNLANAPVSYYGIFTMALWSRDQNPLVYLRGYADNLKAYSLQGGTFNGQQVAQNNDNPQYSFDGMALTANGSDVNTGVLWVTTGLSDRMPTSGILHAYKADDISQELWNSELVPERDRLGSFAKFSAPTVVNGKVYVATFSNQIAVYGLLSSTPQLTTVANSASGAVAPVSPGEMLTLRGVGLGPQTPVQAPDSTTTKLGNVRVLVNNVPAPLLYVSDTQINLVAPADLTGPSVSILVERNNARVDSATLDFADSAPGLFSLNDAGDGPLTALNEDGTLNAIETPAARGSLVSFYATGLQVSTDGTPATVQIDGQDAEVVSIVSGNGLPPGLFQIQVRIPQSANSGRADVISITSGGRTTQTNGTIAVL